MPMLSRALTLLIALLITLPSTRLLPAAPRPAPATPQATAVLIGLRPGVPPLPDGSAPLGPAHNLAITSSNALPVAPGAAPIYRLRLAPGADVAATLATLRAAPALAFAELDQQAIALAVPNDPGYAVQWGLTRIGAEAAWNVTKGSPNIVIAVIDAGLDVNHADLADRLWTNPDLNAPDVHGWNFIANSNDLSDSSGHGTQVAGVIAANADNGIGGAGLCPNCRLMILKVLHADGTANYSDIAAAVGYAAQKGADVINLSLGGISDSAALRSAVSAAAAKAVIVAGAGNGSTSAPFFPAAYNEHVLAVAATTSTDAKVASSNYGPWVDVAAPGETIYTTYSGGGYGDSSGTSMGAPFASGLAGLLLSAHPDWSPADVRAQIIRTAANIDAANPSFVGQLGGGRLAAGAALTTVPTPQLRVAAVTVNGQPGGRPEPGSTAAVAITLANDWLTLADATATLSGPGVTQASATFGTVPALGTQTSAPAFTISVAANAGYNAALGYTLHVTASSGFSADLPLTITTAPGVTDVGATINTQIWTADRVYRVNSETGIPVGQTLTIQPGTVIRFAATGKLRVQGTLIADGTADQPITFTSQDPTKSWAGVVFEDSSQDASFGPNWAYQSGSILRHVTFENSAVQITQAAPYIANNSFGMIDPANFNAMAGPTMYGVIYGTTGGSTALVGNSFNGLNLSLTGPISGELRIADNRLKNANLVASSSGAALEVSGNRVEITDSGVMGGSNPAISVSGAMTVTNNLVIGGGGLRVAQGTNMGMSQVSAVTVSGNLVVGSTGAGLTVEPSQNALYSVVTPTITISANTIVGSTTTTGTVVLLLTLNTTIGGIGPLVISDNNLIVTPGNYGLRLSDNYTATVDARNNYWSGVNPATDALAIYDGNDKYGLGVVAYDPPLATPAQAAPAFVQSVGVAPDTTLGIQTGSFTVHYSRPMDTSTTPALHIEDARRGSFENKGLPTGATGFTPKGFDAKGVLWGIGANKINSYDGAAFGSLDLPAPSTSGMIEMVQDMAIGLGDVKWVLSNNALLRYDGTSWSRFSPCPTQTTPGPTPICSTWSMSARLAVAPDGTVWVLGVMMGATQTEPVTLYHFDGSNWTTYLADSVTASAGMLNAVGLTVGSDGVVWAALQDGNPPPSTSPNTLLRFADGVWTHTTPQIPASIVTVSYQASFQNIVLAPDGTLWASFGAGLGHYAGGSWQFFKGPSTGMGLTGGLAVDLLGVVWTTSSDWVNSFDGHTWRTYKPASGTTTAYPRTLLIDSDGHKWFNTTDAGVSGLYVFRDGYDGAVPTGQWLDDRTYKAETAITALVARGPKRLLITGASDSDGKPAADGRGTTFTVDYAGQVSDRTPPPTPYLFASGVGGDASTVHLTYAASDADSAVDQVRYAIGSAPEAIDIVGWTTPQGTSALAPAALSAVLNTSRSGLSLTAGSTYYVSLQARNTGGLWSAVAGSAFVAGQTTNPRGYIATLSPVQVAVGSGFTLTVNGYGFLSDSTVLWNGVPRTTIYVSATQLQVTISAADTASAGSASVSVRNPAPGGGDSASVSLKISGQLAVGGKTWVYLPLIRR